MTTLDPMSMDLPAARLAVFELVRTLALRDDEIERLNERLGDALVVFDSIKTTFIVFHAHCDTAIAAIDRQFNKED